MAQDNLDVLIKQHGIEITPDQQFYIKSINKTVPVPDSRVDLAGYISGVIRADQRAREISAGEGKPLPGVVQSPVDAAIDKIKSYGIIPSTVADLGIGAAKGLGSTSTNIARAIPGVNRLTVTPEQQSEMMAPTSIPQQVGKTAEQLGEYAYGGSKVAQGISKIMPAALKLAIPLAPRVIPQAMGAGSVAAAQGDDPKIAATIGAFSPQMLKSIGQMAANNPSGVVRTVQAMGLGAMIGIPSFWTRLAIAAGEAMGGVEKANPAITNGIINIGKSLARSSINTPAGMGITGAVTKTADKLGIGQ